MEILGPGIESDIQKTLRSIAGVKILRLQQIIYLLIKSDKDAQEILLTFEELFWKKKKKNLDDCKLFLYF